MATLEEYWNTDPKDMLLSSGLELKDRDGNLLLTIKARVHLDFESRSKFVSFYIPSHPGVEFPELSCLRAVQNVLGSTNDIEAVAGFSGSSEETYSSDLQFTGRVFIYSEDPLSQELGATLSQEASAAGLAAIVRGPDYVRARNAAQRPLAFVSHDHRDKEQIAKPLAIALSSMMCPVWYDEFSLKVGDSLRESIELGLKECHRCIFVLTPNFLANGGWAQREYQSIFTREIIEKQRLILPVWSGVTQEEVFEYSPILADRMGLNWNDGVDVVAGKLVGAIRA